MHVNKQFLEEAAKAKYCHISNSPGTHCAKKCQAFIPEGQSSVQTCETWGTQNWLDTKQEYDLGGNFPQSARLNPISPIYMSYCPEVCDASNLSPGALGPDDQVLNNCIKYGACSQILMDLAYNVVKNGTPVTNPAFSKLVDYAKLDKPLNPNIIAKLASWQGIPAPAVIDMLASAKYGAPGSYTNNAGSPANNFAAAMTPVITTDSPSSTKPTTENVPPKTGIVVSPVTKVTEGFYPPQKISNKGLVVGLVTLIFVIIAIWLIYKLLKH